MPSNTRRSPRRNSRTSALARAASIMMSHASLVVHLPNFFRHNARRRRLDMRGRAIFSGSNRWRPTYHPAFRTTSAETVKTSARYCATARRTTCETVRSCSAAYSTNHRRTSPSNRMPVGGSVGFRLVPILALYRRVRRLTSERASVTLPFVGPADGR